MTVTINSLRDIIKKTTTIITLVPQLKPGTKRILLKITGTRTKIMILIQTIQNMMVCPSLSGSQNLRMRNTTNHGEVSVFQVI
jgi:hypothetical protein